jgi:hypothetical protein
MIPIVLSILIPGLGQIYLGKNWRGVLMVVLGITPLYPAVLVWSAIDAFRLNEQGVTPRFSRREGLWAIAILAVIVPVSMFLVAHLIFTGWESYQDRYSRPDETRKEATSIIQALEASRERHGKYPTALEAVIGQRPLRRDWHTDAWGNRYRYTVTPAGESFRLSSPGSDGEFGTDDDLSFSESP